MLSLVRKIREKRQRNAPYTEMRLQALEAGLVATGTAAAEACAGIVARCFAVAEVTGGQAALFPATVNAMIARDLVLYGQSRWLLGVRDGDLTLDRIGTANVQGGPDEASWRYDVETYGPSDSVGRVVPSESVLDIRLNPPARRPHVGVSPIEAAAGANDLLQAVTKAMADEAGTASGQIVSARTTTEADRARLGKALKAAKGGLALVQGGNADDGGLGVAVSRFGPGIPPSLPTAHDAATRAVFSAVGVPLDLAFVTPGATAREGLRRLHRTLLSPYAALVAAECSRKGVDAAWSFAPVKASDLAGAARAFGILRTNEVETERALLLSGLADER